MSMLVCVDDYEAEAKKKLTPVAAGYYASGSCTEQTLQLNRTAFQALRLRPRVLRPVAKRDLSVTVLGRKVAIPIAVAPTAMQKMAHPQGEIANARAAGRMGTILTLSTLSNCNVEEVAQGAPDTILWFQLYLFKDRRLSEQLVQRVIKSGYKALVLTVDASAWGKRRADVRNKFALPSHLGLGNFSGDLAKMSSKSQGSALTDYVNNIFDLDITWEDVKWLKRISNLPIVVKGILTAEDALIAADIGADGLVVSNHGGRQLDGCPATIEALPEIVNAVGHRMEVYLDGGIRTGTDVFRALALGARMVSNPTQVPFFLIRGIRTGTDVFRALMARMVFVGRPALWGLACGGEEGVKDVLNILASEFDIALALTGCKSVAEIRSDMVVHESRYSKL